MDPNRYRQQGAGCKGSRQQAASKGARQQTASKGVRQQAASNKSANSPHPQTSQPPPTCCLMHKNQRCHNPVGKGKYEGNPAQKPTGKQKLKVDHRARHTLICDQHLKMIQEDATRNAKRQNQDYSFSGSDDNDTESNEEHECDEKERETDFDKSGNSLEKYKQYVLIGNHNVALTEVAANHSKSVLPDEIEILADFIYKTKYC